MKRILAFVFALTLLLVITIPVFAVDPSYPEVSDTSGSLSNFRRTGSFSADRFADVIPGAWYADNVAAAYEYGLLLGYGNGLFGVGADTTVGQVIAIADRLHNRYYGGSGAFVQGKPWYQIYVEYAEHYGLIASGQYDPAAVATRAQFAVILSAALPAEALEPINRVEALPDVRSTEAFFPAVLRLYNAGILNGNDEYGTFCPDRPISREQVAAMASRVADQNLRKRFTLRPKDAGTDEKSYEETVFDSSYVHRIDIQISGEDWGDLAANPLNRTKYRADISIDGEALKDVAISTKGNSSLAFVAAEYDVPRFSFRVNFGMFVEGQSYHGLKTLALNNSFCDATFMKDHISYRIFREAGVPAPLTSFVWLTVNGKDHGLYLAVEGINESFLDRVYDGEGVLYEPESSTLGLTLDDVKYIRENGMPKAKDPHGSDLVYRDDDPESYPDIFEKPVTAAEQKDDLAVIAAMKVLSEGADPGACLDTDEIIRYFAAHNFTLNYDSYTGAMLHNLYLYENNGVVSLLPWDYNLAYGTFIPGVGYDVLKDATNLLNQGIDTPLIGTDEELRPMWKWIVNDDAYRSEYHNALDSLIKAYFASGRFDREMRELHEMLLPYVEKDPTAFYSPEEFSTGCEVLRQFCERRAQSIRLQLDGKLPAIGADQPEQDKVSASDLNVMDMGAFVDKLP